jgi:signal transduction histidine kinase
VAQVFEPFVRGDNKSRAGHGVGLTIVKRLSDRFGWPVRFESTVGVGTRVAVEFPDAACQELAPQNRVASPVDEPLS